MVKKKIRPEEQVENIHIRELKPILSPYEVKSRYKPGKKSIETVTKGRNAIRSALKSNPLSKLIVIVGPCSVNDPASALEYANWLKDQRDQYGDKLELVMRLYFEKPRTTVGWKGLINDPDLDESYDINKGLLTARKLVCDIADLGVPIGTELLDTTTPQYFAGLVSWGAIGARTTESQLHRELASGLSFPVGFKNGTSGNVNIAVDAVTSASFPHRFLGTTDKGQTAIVSTSGNKDCHIILRGGSQSTNYDVNSITQAISKLKKAGQSPLVMVDCSHGNSNKDHTKQIAVVKNLADQITGGSKLIMGVMIESNLKPGSQSFVPGKKHEYGKSITDACVGLDETTEMFELLYDARAKLFK